MLCVVALRRDDAVKVAQKTGGRQAIHNRFTASDFAGILRPPFFETGVFPIAAYLIARINVIDPEQYEEYKKLSPGAIEAFGGEFIVRGGQTETLEGAAETNRLVVVRFDSMERARECYHSEKYQHAKGKREGAAEAQFVIVDGV